MINQGITRLTISGLCQWDKGQKVQISTEDVSPVLNFYATQDRDDGTTLQFKLEAPPYGVGTTFKLDIPNKMLEEAIKSDGVEEVFSTESDMSAESVDLFSDEYVERISRIKQPNSKVKVLTQLLKKQITEFKKVNNG